MKRYLTLITAGVIATALDITIFAQAGGMCPCMLLAVALASCVSLNVQSAIITALVGGLVIDALTNSYLGLTAACCLLSVSVLYLMIRKNHPKLFMLWLYAFISVVIASPIVLLYSYLLGARFQLLRTLAVEVVPSGVLTGLCVLPVVKLLDWAKINRRDRIATQ